MHCCNDGGPCPISPHPDLLARERAERLAAGHGANSQALLSGGSTSSVKPRDIPGLNDGTIFPESHFGPEATPSQIANAALARAPLRGAIRVAVVLVDFSDQPMTAGASQRFKDLFFSNGKIPTGSVTEYYSEVSGGKISMTGEVVGPFRMPLTMVQYAHGQSGFKNNVPEPNIRTLGKDALDAAKGKINLAPYDNDGNGMVDAFVVVHAGPGAEVDRDLNKIWSVKWNLPTSTPVDGVNVFAFLTVPEDGFIGVCAHELGHLIFGWPDLYDDDLSSEGIGNWCLMAGGSWGGSPGGTTPCHPSAWCKENQGWVDVINETENRSLSLQDVKTPTARHVHRLWKDGNATSSEYFLLENRQRTGFDKSLPGPGLLIWHIDDSVEKNNDERHYKVALMQADGKNQLATSTAGRGDAGDPFPGSTNNTAFTSASLPNSLSYTGQDTSVSVTNISPAAATMTMNIAVKSGLNSSFAPVYHQGDPGTGIGGYDLRSTADLAFAFDHDSSGKLDHLVFIRPGTGTCWILGNTNGIFKAKYAQGDPGTGIGGYDLKSSADRAFAFDYNSSGKLDHLVLYRPGKGAIFIVKNTGGVFTAVYAQGDPGSGIGGFDLRSPADRLFAFDYNSSGKLDHLCLYRPGTGTMWILKQKQGTFNPVYAQGDPGTGIGGFDLKSPADRAYAFDWDSSGKQDHIVLYRPGTGTFWCLRNDSGVFKPVIAVGSPGQGIGGYDLRSAADVSFAYDWTRSGKNDHVAFYRPGTGTFWVLQRLASGGFKPVLAEGDPGKGIGGFDLKSPADKAFAFDYEHSGKQDYVVLYRTNASGTIWILKHAFA